MAFFIVVISIRVSIVNSVVMIISIIRVPSVGSIITVISFILMLLGFLGLLGLFWRGSDISSQVSMLRLTFYRQASIYCGLLVLLGLF